MTKILVMVMTKILVMVMTMTQMLGPYEALVGPRAELPT